MVFRLLRRVFRFPELPTTPAYLGKTHMGFSASSGAAPIGFVISTAAQVRSGSRR